MADTQTGGKTLVTSFNTSGYKRYGEKFLKSFRTFWPRQKLVVFYEGDFQGIPENEYKVSWHPIESVTGWPQFEEKLFPLMTGKVGLNYDINFDARMCRKVFIQCHAGQLFGGKVFWIDADTILREEVPDDFLDTVLPDDKFNCYLGRDGWYYTESGFIGFNMNHQLAEHFMAAYKGVVESGVIFGQPGWHACFAFDSVRLGPAKPYADAFANLAKDVPHGTMHPQAQSILGKYMWHLKGDRKDTGKLREGDLG